jgi:hypothetical protein
LDPWVQLRHIAEEAPSEKTRKRSEHCDCSTIRGIDVSYEC